jgi:hypothetical protein
VELATEQLELPEEAPVSGSAVASFRSMTSRPVISRSFTSTGITCLFVGNWVCEAGYGVSPGLKKPGQLPALMNRSPPFRPGWVLCNCAVRFIRIRFDVHQVSESRGKPKGWVMMDGAGVKWEVECMSW